MSTVFRTEDQPVASRGEYWRHAVDRMGLLLEGHPVNWAEANARMRVGEVGAVRVIEASTPPGVCARPPRLARQADPDTFQVDVLTRGHLVVDHEGRESGLTAGDLTVIDPARPVRLVASAPADPVQEVDHVTLRFPRQLLPLRGDDLMGLAGLRIPGNHGTGALASSLARQLPRHMDETDGPTAARLGTAMVDLLATALATLLDSDRMLGPDARRRALLLRIHAFIEERLGHPGLSPASIADAHHISTRLLHKLFQERGETVAGWVRRRRLERSRRDLLDPALRDRPVVAIATRWGFASPIHFSRVFRAAYGAPPHEYRQQYRGTDHE